jgi:hypothetical protein
MTLFTTLRSNLYLNLTKSVALTATLALFLATNQVQAQRFDTIPDLERIWDGGFSVRPVNGVDMPWNETNFPKLNARAKAYQEVWEETVAPKYDCQPASSPAIQYDPYHMQITQWPDRVLLRYEKDDQLRTIWLDGREPSAVDFSLQGFSVGTYEDDALIVTTTHFVFDIAGFDDYNGIPSSAQKILTEKYWIEGEQLNMTLTLEDPMFLLEPASYTTRWLPAAKGYKLDVYDCDAEASRASVRFFPSKYDD